MIMKLTEYIALYPTPDTVRALEARYRLGHTDLARLYGIPVRTVEEWASGRHDPPPYVLAMLNFCLYLQFPDV